MSLQDAFDLCQEFAKERYNRGPKRIAHLMGVKDWVLYKWLKQQTMPTNRIEQFEVICGCNYVTQWLAISGQKLLIDIPATATDTSRDLLRLQLAMNKAAGALIEGNDPAEIMAAITAAMEQLAWHREQLEQGGVNERD